MGRFLSRGQRLVPGAELQLLHHQPLRGLRDDLEPRLRRSSIIPEIAAVLEKSFQGVVEDLPELLRARRLHQHVGAQHLLPAVDLRRLSGVVHAELEAAARSRLGQAAVFRLAAAIHRRARISTKTTSPASASMDTGNLRFRTTVARPARSSCSCRSSRLALPEDSPFWTAKENDGMWVDLGRRFRSGPCWKSRASCWSITAAAALRRSSPARSMTTTTTIRSSSSIRISLGKTTTRRAAPRRNTASAAWTRAICAAWTSIST